MSIDYDASGLSGDQAAHGKEQSFPSRGSNAFIRKQCTERRSGVRNRTSANVRKVRTPDKNLWAKPLTF